MSNNKDLTIVPAAGTAVVTSGMEMTVATGAEISARAQESRAVAENNARFALAMQNPRSVEHFRLALLQECKRPGLAEISKYARPVGREQVNGEWVDKIATGPTIHLMRTAFRLFRNVGHTQRIVAETPEHRTVAETVVDYENGFYLEGEFLIDKKLERRGDKNGQPPKDGQEYLSSRLNTEGKPVFLRRMTPDEVRKEQARMGALTKRRLLEELIPRDIIQEALAICEATNKGEYAKDPDGRKRKMIDKFREEFSVTPEMLSDFLGQSIDNSVTLQQINQLIGVFGALKDGDTWEDIMAAKNPAGTTEAAAQTAAEKLAGGGKPKETPKPDATVDGEIEKLVAAFAWLEDDMKAQILKSVKVTDIKDCPPEFIGDTLALIEMQVKKGGKKK